MLFQNEELREKLYSHLYLDNSDATKAMLKRQFDPFKNHPLDVATDENVASSTSTLATAFVNEDGTEEFTGGCNTTADDMDGNYFPVPPAQSHGNECTCKLIYYYVYLLLTQL